MQPPDYLAPGEDVSTSSAREAQHWRDFYRRRASFEETVRLLKSMAGQLTDGPRRDLFRQALPKLIADAERFRLRLDFWEARVAQLV